MTNEKIETIQVDDDENDPDEYFVEDIRAERRNPKTGVLEYLIKWESYPESANTWEPVEHLKCPDVIKRFREQEKNKRKRRSTTDKQDTPTKKTKTHSTPESAVEAAPKDPLILVEDEGSSTETLSSSASEHANVKDVSEPVVQPKGFDRGLKIEKIIGSCTDDDDKLWFFVKWVGLGEIELVAANEIEEKEPREMCVWYRERLYYTIKNASTEA